MKRDRHHGKAWLVVGLLLCLVAGGMRAQPFHLPTHNQALYEPNGAARYFAPTTASSWPGGVFGCVRSHGYQFHEGIDILPVKRDARGEPADSVFATAAGRVAYLKMRVRNALGRRAALQLALDIAGDFLASLTVPADDGWTTLEAELPSASNEIGSAWLDLRVSVLKGAPASPGARKGLLDIDWLSIEWRPPRKKNGGLKL